MRGVYRGAALALLLVAAAAGAAPPESIRLPKQPAVPSPMPAPGGVLRLAGESLYVIDCKVDAVVRAHPAGLVKVQKKKGPRDISARFVDGTGLVEDRTYDGPFVFVVTAAGTGRVELDVIPIGLKSEAEIVSAVIDVDAGQGPRPPPTPDPKPDPKVDPAPDPKPKDVPLAAEPAGLRVLIVYDSLDKDMTAGQRDVIFGGKVREWLDANAVRDGYRMWPKVTAADLEGAERHWKDAAARKRDSLPWAIISNGRTFYEGPLPADADKFIAEATKHKGSP